jgi:hypothetical protein
MPTVDGDLCLLSTPRGKRGFFYKEWADGGPEWTRVSVTAAECPRIRPEFLEGERRSMGEEWAAAGGVFLRVRGRGFGVV